MGKIQTSKKRGKSPKNTLRVKAAGVSRRALFKLMEPNANPTLESLAKVCKALTEVA